MMRATGPEPSAHALARLQFELVVFDPKTNGSVNMLVWGHGEQDALSRILHECGDVQVLRICRARRLQPARREWVPV